MAPVLYRGFLRLVNSSNGFLLVLVSCIEMKRGIQAKAWMSFFVRKLV